MLKRGAVLVLSLGTGVFASGACQPEADRSVELNPRAQRVTWGDYRMVRHERSAHEVLTRARLIASIVLQTDDLPDISGLPQPEISQWEEKARNDPYREGAVRFNLDGRDVLARYRPATDRLTISAMDTRVRPMEPAAADPGIGDDAALAAARGCLARLEELGVVGSAEFSTEPTITGHHPVQFDHETSWVERYTFMFNPVLDGLRLRSAEVVIAVNAWSGVCQRITVGGQVKVERVGAATVSLTDAEQAATLVKKKVMLGLPAVRGVHVTGEFGYYLPVDESSIIVSPMFLARYAAESGTTDMPVVGRSSIAGLPLQDPAHEELVDLLGPL